MKMVMKCLCLMCVLLVTCLASYSLGYNDKVTHRDLTRRAIDYSLLVNGKDTLSAMLVSDSVDKILSWPGYVCDEETGKNNCNIIDWLSYGAEKEDENRPWNIFRGRFENHFHNPLKAAGDEGLTDTVFEQGESSFLTAHCCRLFIFVVKYHSIHRSIFPAMISS